MEELWKKIENEILEFSLALDENKFKNEAIFLNSISEIKEKILLKENYNRNNFKRLRDVADAIKIIIEASVFLFEGFVFDEETSKIFDETIKELNFEINHTQDIYKFIGGHFSDLTNFVLDPNNVKTYGMITDIFKETSAGTTEKTIPKFKWKGTPAQLAFIVNLLQVKGYIEGLTPYGERNAKLLLSHFDIDGFNSTPGSLGKCFQQLKNDELPINKEDAAQFQRIPNRNDLKK